MADFCFVGSGNLIATVGNGGALNSNTNLNNTYNLSGAGGIDSLSFANYSNTFSFNLKPVGAEEQEANHLALLDTLLPPPRARVLSKF